MFARLTIQVTLMAAIAASLAAAPPTGAEPNVIPRPAKVEAGEGTFELTAATTLAADADARAEAEKLAAALRTATGFELPVRANAKDGSVIRLQLDAALEAELGKEGYALAVEPAGVVIRAAAPAGLFYGGVTLRQLLPEFIFCDTVVKQVSRAVPEIGGHVRLEPPRPVRWIVPCVRIADRPRFAWRGLLLDPARHFLPPADVKRMIDLIALHKLNSLQIHLTDDQGWRIEIRKYPLLTQVGSVRAESPRRGDRRKGDGKPYGPFFYTQAQVRELVAYAAERHVTIVPEIEMPGHFLAALSAFPHLSCTGGPFKPWTRWGISHDILCPGNDKSVQFAQDVLAEVVELFPSRFIHIGGDEAPRDRWKACPKCQARMKAEGLASEAQLQTWFNSRIEKFLASKGRRMIGWDEILEGGLTPQAAVMSWRGTAGGLAAAGAGHDVVMSPTSHCYFDYAQSKAPGEPEAIGRLITLSKVYEFEPIPAGLPAERHNHILGAQGNLWSEYLHGRKDVEYFAFPRAAALAEAVWSPAAPRDFADFRARLAVHLRRLDQLDVNYRKETEE